MGAIKGDTRSFRLWLISEILRKKKKKQFVMGSRITPSILPLGRFPLNSTYLMIIGAQEWVPQGSIADILRPY